MNNFIVGNNYYDEYGSKVNLLYETISVNQDSGREYRIYLVKDEYGEVSKLYKLYMTFDDSPVGRERKVRISAEKSAEDKIRAFEKRIDILSEYLAKVTQSRAKIPNLRYKVGDTVWYIRKDSLSSGCGVVCAITVYIKENEIVEQYTLRDDKSTHTNDCYLLYDSEYEMKKALVVWTDYTNLYNNILDLTIANKKLKVCEENIKRYKESLEQVEQRLGLTVMEQHEST